MVGDTLKWLLFQLTLPINKVLMLSVHPQMRMWVCQNARPGTRTKL